MTATSLAKAGPGFCGRGDFLARDGLRVDFLCRCVGFRRGMRGFFLRNNFTVRVEEWQGVASDRYGRNTEASGGLG